jgi:hypothetical protein
MKLMYNLLFFNKKLNSIEKKNTKEAYSSKSLKD